MKYFLISVQRVILSNNPPVREEWIRGDMVRYVRKWNKSNEDLIAVGGEMTQVTLLDPLTKLHTHIRIEEQPEDFAKRLFDHKKDANNNHTDRRPVAEPAG